MRAVGLSAACAASAVALAAAVPASHAAVVFRAHPQRHAALVTVASQSALLGPGPVAAWGSYNDTIASNGWSWLSISTNASFSDDDQAYAAGYLEASLTAQRIYEMSFNVHGASTTWSPAMTQFVHENVAWMQQMVASNAASDPWWYHVGLVLRQFEGLYDGYTAAAPANQSLSKDTLYALSLMGDMDDLCAVYGCESRADAQSRAIAQQSGATPGLRRYQQQRYSDGHCSVLVKPTGYDERTHGFKDLFIGHATWGSFESMTRVYKTYDMPFMAGKGSASPVPARSMSFSSYPGVLYSNDDYYQTSAGMVITETTIENNNASLWAAVTAQTVPDWARNMVANRLAADAQGWCDVFSRYNSGTYNNEFMLLDMKKFTPGAPLPESGLLWVLEQLPGAILAMDHTGYLHADNKSYWASYNRMSYPSFFTLSNQTALVEAYGAHFTYNATSRAVIFDQRHGEVADDASYAALLRYNRWQTDTIASQGCEGGAHSGSNAISERGDLTPAGKCSVPGLEQQDEAGVDAKFTSWGRVMGGGDSSDPRLAAIVQSGPTTYDKQPPFVWSESPFADIPHMGQPDRWDFPWVAAEWKDGAWNTRECDPSHGDC